VLVAGGWLVRRLSTGVLTRRSALDLPLGLFVCGAWLSVIVSFNQGEQWLSGFPTPLLSSWAKFWTLVGAVALFYALANLHGEQLIPTAGALALFGAGAGAYFVLTNDWQAAPKLDTLAQVGAALSTWVPAISVHRLHPNEAGGLIAMLWPFGVQPAAQAWRARRPIWMACWTGIQLWMLFALLLTQSRGAWLALLVVWLAWLAMQQLGALSIGARGRTFFMGALLLVLLLLAANVERLGAWLPVGLPVAAGGPVSVTGRIDLWRGAWSLAQAVPFTGGGPGSFAMLYSTYVLMIPVFFITHSHNLFLDILVEQGVPGLVLFGIFVTATVYAAVPALRAAGHTRRLAQSALASLAVLLLHGLIDDFAYGSRGLLLLFVPAGLIVAAASEAQVEFMQIANPVCAVRTGQQRREEKQDGFAPLPPGAGSFFAGVPRVGWIVAAFALVALTGLTLERATVASAWHANLGALRQAQAELDGYHFPDRIPDLARQNDDEEAIAEYTLALAYDPANRTAAVRLGGIALAKRQYEQARAYLAPAYAADPTDLTARRLMGDAELALGRLDEAYALWATVPGAEAILRGEAAWRYEQAGDALRAGWTRALAERIQRGQ
jgi:O-antigen ligase